VLVLVGTAVVPVVVVVVPAVVVIMRSAEDLEPGLCPPSPQLYDENTPEEHDGNE
jgi:hypothetical protein